MPMYEVVWSINGQASTNRTSVKADSESEAKKKIKEQEERKGYTCKIVSVKQW